MEWCHGAAPGLKLFPLSSKGKVEAVYPQKEGCSLWRLLTGDDGEETLSRLVALPYLQPAYLPTWFK